MTDDEFDAEFYEATGIILGSGTIQAVRNFVAAREAAAAAERDRLAAEVDRLLSDATHLACIVTGVLPDKSTMTPDECRSMEEEAHDCAHKIMREYAAHVKARAALAEEGSDD